MTGSSGGSISLGWEVGPEAGERKSLSALKPRNVYFRESFFLELLHADT